MITLFITQQSFEDLFRKKNLIFFLVAAISFLILFNCFLAPPFIETFWREHGKAYRLIIEASIIITLLLSLKPKDGDILYFLGIFFIFYTLNYLYNDDPLTNHLSHYLKLVFLVTLPRFLKNYQQVCKVLTFSWILFWTYESLAAILQALIYNGEALEIYYPYSIFDYDYHSYPGLGYFVFRKMKGLEIIRYVGLFFEPISLAFYFGFNIFAAPILIESKLRRNLFIFINAFGGFLTLSFSFYFFIPIMFIGGKIEKVLPSKVKIWLLISLFLILFFCFNIFSEQLIQFFDISSSSIFDRVNRITNSFSFYANQTYVHKFYGTGLIFFHNSMKRGTSCGLLDVLVSRGLIILIGWIYLIFLATNRAKKIFIFVMLYSLVLDFWHFPLTILALSLVYAHTCSRT